MCSIEIKIKCFALQLIKAATTSKSRLLFISISNQGPYGPPLAPRKLQVKKTT